MKTILAASGLALVLLVPTGAIAKPDKSERKAAKAECKAERGASRAAFKANYDGFADCVGKKAKKEEAENEAAAKNAAKECKAERDANPTTFKTTYGTNRNGRNAFGKCVSEKVRGR